MPQRPFSKSALGVAQLRAVHQFLDGEPKILEDAVVPRLLGAGAVEQLKVDFAAGDMPLRRGLRAEVVLRARYTEELLAVAAHRGVRQYVILGAGLDTFAYRQPDWARCVSIYEVDHLASQDDKRRRLQTAAIAIPENLQFITADFEAAPLHDTLHASRLDFSAPAFFSCLGVLVYLTRRAVDAVFELVAAFPMGSEIVFTFSAPENATTELAARLDALGEPWLTHLDPETLSGELGARGFSPVSLLRAEDAERGYFLNRSDGLRPANIEKIASAVVGERRD
jgi:methyltransferase (TIGR00027 family)